MHSNWVAAVCVLLACSATLGVNCYEKESVHDSQHRALLAASPIRSPRRSPSPLQTTTWPGVPRNMVPWPFHKAYFFPGPSPQELPMPSTLPVPTAPQNWFPEPDTGRSRSTQNRFVFGPIDKLPSSILLQGIIDMKGRSTTSQTQGAIFLHQEYDYYGGTEVGFVYYFTSGKLAFYQSVENNIVGKQHKKDAGSPNNSFNGRFLNYRIDIDMASKNFKVAATSPTNGRAWWTTTVPFRNWFTVDPVKPWWLTITWQKLDNSTISGAVSNATYWYLP